jgi:hypothetical protein
MRILAVATNNVNPMTAGVDFYYADGNGGQHIIVAPDLDLVVVFTGSHYNANPQLGLTMFDKFVVDAIR